MGEVRFVTREGCHLCEVAAPVVRRAAADAGAAYAEEDVDASPAAREQWGHLVPVVLLDGVRHSVWDVDERVLRAALGLRR